MKPFPVIAFILFAHAACADPFTNRVAAGQAASVTPAGIQFDASVSPLIANTGQICDPPGSVLPAADIGQFQLVGDVTRTGKLINVAVRPQTPIAECFALQFARNMFALPPTGGNYPILVQFNVSK
jgi:hypothetical protein